MKSASPAARAHGELALAHSIREALHAEHAERVAAEHAERVAEVIALGKRMAYGDGARREGSCAGLMEML